MISANTLFHFTNSIENLQNILTNNFSPRYCIERIDYIGNSSMDLGIPMICFCDIPLSQTTEHVNTYGSYAIGLKKEWAIKNSITPVLYIHDDSQTKKIINSISGNLIKLDGFESIFRKEFKGHATMEAMELLFFCKKYAGVMWREGALRENVIFYNEREWRYVPKIKELNRINPKLIISKEEYDEPETRKKFNDDISVFKTTFTPKDIKYIIIKAESERLEIIDRIIRIKGNFYSHDELKELSSKIISVEQIKEDF